MTTEFELKLEVPPARARAVRAALARLEPKTEKLRAIYYDTPERLLQRGGLALRVRSENGAWVQTLKAASGRSLARLEHEVTLPRTRDVPRPAAARHVDSALGEQLLRVLGRGFDDSAWEPLFETDVERTKALVTHGASRIEIAFDKGHIAAGRRRLALSEVEFELKDGEPGAAVQVARDWCARHGLWLSTISKAHKGVRLARGDGSFGAAASAAETRFDDGALLRRIAGEALGVSLDQVIRNASELAAGRAADEHVHQLRAGIRRTRMALREPVREDTGAEERALVHAFRELGKHRDVTHVLRTIAPKLREMGGPLPDESVNAHAPVPARVVRAPAFRNAVLSLLALACNLRADGADARVAFVDKLKKVQDALGEYNDEMTALAHYRELAATHDARALFAVGWLTADRERCAHECGRLLRKFAKPDPFWE